MSVKLRAPADNTVVTVTFTETSLYATSSVVVNLPEANQLYHVAPLIRWNHERLAAQSQPWANFVVRADVTFHHDTSDKLPTSYLAKIVVHSVNDAIQTYRPRPPTRAGQVDYNTIEWSTQGPYFLTAYVNENHPWIDQRITRHALKHIDSFQGYQRPSDSVRKEVEAIYRTLTELGFKYVNFPQASAAINEDHVQAQAIRTVGDTIESAQANGIETVMLIASVLYKMGIDVEIFRTPDRESLLGVYLERPTSPTDRSRSFLVLDPRMLGRGSFDEAVASGPKLLPDNLRELLSRPTEDDHAGRDRFNAAVRAAESTGAYVINVGLARLNGILPIPDIRRQSTGHPASSSNVVIMNPPKSLVGYGLLTSALTPFASAQIIHESTNSGPGAGGQSLWLIIGVAVLALIVGFFVGRSTGKK